jgi:hypothetical protein
MKRIGVMLVAVALAGCGSANRNEGQRPLELRRGPFMGVACPKAYSIACDRVGLALWLTKPANAVTASIGGRAVKMHSPGEFVTRKGNGWEGYLRPAGLKDGPLKVEPDAGPDRWVGRKPVFARVLVTAYYDDGSAARRTVRVSLAPGWG